MRFSYIFGMGGGAAIYCLINCDNCWLRNNWFLQCEFHGWILLQHLLFSTDIVIANMCRFQKNVLRKIRTPYFRN